MSTARTKATVLRLFRLPRYVGALGPVEGLVCFLACLWLGASPRRRDPSAAVRVSFRWRGRPMECLLRPGSSDVDVFEQVFALKSYELDVVPAGRSLLASQGRTEGVILDLGANVGYSALALAAQFPRARIVCVEPDAANFALLRRNVGALPNVVCVRAAVWSAEGTVRLDGAKGGEWAFRVEGAATRPGMPPESRAGTASGETSHTDDPRTDDPGMVPALRMSTLIERHAGGRPLVGVKMDIEGGEAEIFRDDTAWLGSLSFFLFEPHDWMEGAEPSAHRVLREVGKRPYALAIMDENLFFAFR